MEIFKTYTSSIDWILVGAMLPLLGMGLLTMNTFAGDNYFFERQLAWIGIGFSLFFIFSRIDWRFLKRTDILTGLYALMVGVLLLLILAGHVTRGVQSWLEFSGFVFQPSDPAKIFLVLILAKYFSRRHIEIAHIKHILISFVYLFIFFLLVFLQPDFGSAVILFFIWFGMIIVSGVSKKHLLFVLGVGAFSLISLWTFVFEDYQRARITTFLNPLTDIQGTGYNAYQSVVSVGAGELYGRGVGYGTQSRLQFLPEYHTDFIFAAYAEEWGFLGVILFFVLFGIVLWRILSSALHGASNFEMLFGVGLSIYLMSHFFIHVGMNIGLLPVTGITLPFLSYGGSHLITEFAALGILMGMRRYGRIIHREAIKNEMVGV